MPLETSCKTFLFYVYMYLICTIVYLMIPFTSNKSLRFFHPRFSTLVVARDNKVLQTKLLYSNDLFEQQLGELVIQE